MKKTIIVALVVMSFVLSGSYALGITNGQPDADRHPYVGLIVFEIDGYPAWRCSGSLIAPTIVLTAGHCTDGAVAARVWFYEDVTYDNVPDPLYPYGGPGSGATEGTPYTNPDFCLFCGNGLPNQSHRDVGVVVLDEPVFMDNYAELPEAGLVDTLKNMTDLDLVGYGYQERQRGGGPPFWTGLRIRLYATSQLISGKFVQSDEFMKHTMNPGGGKGGTCYGDSGGPNLISGTNTLLAITTHGANNNCVGVGYSSRIDIPEILEWIESFMP